MAVLNIVTKKKIHMKKAGLPEQTR